MRYPFKIQNSSKTFTEECAIRGILEKTQDSLDILNVAFKSGYTLSRMKDIAQKLISNRWLHTNIASSFIDDVKESRPHETQQEILDFESDSLDTRFGDLLPKIVKSDYVSMLDTFTDSQRHSFEWVETQLKKVEANTCMYYWKGRDR